MTLSRRQFLKGLSAILALPISEEANTLLAAEHIEALLPGHGIKIESLGRVIVCIGEHGNPDDYIVVLRYHLSKKIKGKLLEAYAEIDQELLNLVEKKQEFIRAELQPWIEAMLIKETEV